MWSDKESEKDYLNFGEVSQLAVDILNSKDMLPVSIGIFGNWGAGKSSLLKLIEHDLEESSEDFIVIKFDAWLYQGYDDSRAALLEVIASSLIEETKENENLFKKTKKLLSRVDGIRALGLLMEGGALLTGTPTGGVISRATNALSGLTDGVQGQAEIDSATGTAQDAVEHAQGLLKESKEVKSPPQQIDAFREEYSVILEELDKPLVVVIDNLDRCLPQNAIHTLEAIRLFLFLTNTAFIIAADEEMIRSAVSNYFEGHQNDIKLII